MRRPFQERRYSRGDKLQRPVPAVNAQAFSKFKAALKKQNEVGNTQGRDAFSTCAARIPHPPERAVTSVKEPGAAPHPVL